MYGISADAPVIHAETELKRTPWIGLQSGIGCPARPVETVEISRCAVLGLITSFGGYAEIAARVISRLQSDRESGEIRFAVGRRLIADRTAVGYFRHVAESGVIVQERHVHSSEILSAACAVSHIETGMESGERSERESKTGIERSIDGRRCEKSRHLIVVEFIISCESMELVASREMEEYGRRARVVIQFHAGCDMEDIVAVGFRSGIESQIDLGSYPDVES